MREIEAENVKEALGGEARPGEAFKHGTLLVQQDELDALRWTIKYCNTLATDILGQESAEPLLERSFWDVFTLAKPRSSSSNDLDADATPTCTCSEDFEACLGELTEFRFSAHTTGADGHKVHVSVRASSGIASLLACSANIAIPVDLESEASLKSSLWFLTVDLEGVPGPMTFAADNAPRESIRPHHQAMLFVMRGAWSRAEGKGVPQVDRRCRLGCALVQMCSPTCPIPSALP